MNRKPSGRISRDDFYTDVYEVVRLIPRGRVTTYGSIAKYLGAAKSSRLVGYAMNHSFTVANVPAHRVVNRNGVLTGKHHFPPERSMEASLAEEGVVVVDDAIVNFQEHYWDPSVELAL